mgnify:FL=1
MKDAILKTMSANEIVRRGCEPNVVQNVFNPNQVYSVNPNVFTFTITGSATGAKVIVANIDGQVMSFSTTAAQTAAAAATAIAAAWASALNTAYGASAYTATAALGVITLTRNDGGAMLNSFYYSTDTTQRIAMTTGWIKENYALFQVQAAGTGAGRREGDGYAVQFDLPNSNRSVKLFVNSYLVNESGAAKTARWRINWYYPTIGWRTDTTAGLMSVSSAGTAGTEIVYASSGFETVGATRVSIELVDNGGGSALTSAFFYANAVVVN